MISKKEFLKTVETMRRDGVPITILNVMIRTDLPRAKVVAWIMEDEATEEVTEPDDLDRLRQELRAQIDRVKKIEMPKLPQLPKKRSWQVAATLGFVFGPLGLFYASPVALAASASSFYVAALVVLHYLPFVGPAILGYIIPLVHIGCAALNAYYAFFKKKAK